MIMMQQAFNDILLNVTQANDLISNETSKSSKSFFDPAQIILDNSTNNSTLTSSILKNNFFSNNKENYNLNDGTPATSNDKQKSSPLSSGLSSLSSSLISSSSSSPSSLFSNTSGASSLSRSSSTCSLLSSTIKQQQQQDQQHQHPFNKAVNKSSSSSPGLLNDLFFSSSISPPLGSSVSSTNSSSLDTILPFNFCMQPSSSSPALPKPTTSSDLNSFSFGLGLENNSCNANVTSCIDWNLLNSLTEQNQRYLLARDDCQWISKLNKEFCWNINKLTEMVLMSSKFNESVNANPPATNATLANNFNLPPSCNINVNNNSATNNINSSNYGMNNNNNMNNNNSNKLPRKIVGNSLSTPIAAGNQQQASPNMQPHSSGVNKFYSMNQPSMQQQQNNTMMNFNTNQQTKMNNLTHQNYNNQQFNLSNNNNRTFGRIITNNRGYPQRIQC